MDIMKSEELDISDSSNIDKGSLGSIFEFHSKRVTENTNATIKCSSHEKIE